MNRMRGCCLALAAVTAASLCPVTAQASESTYDLRKRVMELTGIMNPSDGSRFISRAEFAAMLVRASEYRSTVADASSVSVFADVPADSAYAPHIRIAARQGWMKGYLGGMFRPEESVTLKDAVRAVLALLGYTDEDFAGDQSGSRMAKYSYLELNENLEWIQSEEILTEDNCLNLLYNLLKTPAKGSQNIYGSIMDLTLSTDGEINPLEMLDTSVKGPYVVKKIGSVSSKLPFDIDKASFYMDGEPCTKANVKAMLEDYGYAVMYYNSTSKTVWIYTPEGSETTGKTVLQGEITNIYYKSSEVLTPTAVTLTTEDGEEYECSLNSSDLQFAFSIYGTVEVGDEVVLVCSGSSENEDGAVTYQVTDFLED
ncbi:MAG: S-layer homology domain-containing protein [Lachnospiraceae bacterium]|nr:S-layer homology domain-containing protein [Lachnospiraceae bacterium]